MEFLKKILKKKISQKYRWIKNQEKSPTKLYTYSLLFAVILITALYLKPLLSSGWYADETSASLSLYVAKMNDVSLLEKIKGDLMGGGKVPGRFFPLAGYAFILFTIVPNVVTYKSIVLCLILFSIFLFYHFVKRISGNQHLALLTCAIMPAFFQFRFFYDPILYGSALMPVTLSLTLMSLILLDIFLETDKWRFLLLSAIIYLISVLTYEITYAFILLHISIIFIRRRNLRDVLRYGILFGACLSIAVIGSMNERIKFGAQTVETYQIHFVPNKYFWTTLKQLYAAFPLSYDHSNPQQVLPQTRQYRLSHMQPPDLVVVGLFLICFFYLITKAKLNKESRKRLLIFGLLLFILPSLMIGLSGTFQYLLVFGIGYLPVYIQYFGVCLFLVSITSYISQYIRPKNVKRILVFCLAALLSTTLLVNLQNNRVIVEQINRIYWYPRNVVEVSAKNGLFNQVPINATLVMETDDGLSLDYPFFIYSLTNREIFAINSKGIVTWYQGVIKSKSIPPIGASEKYYMDKGPVFFFRYWSDSTSKGYVVISKVLDFQTDPKFMKTAVKTKSLDIFILGDLDPNSNISFNKISLDSKGNVRTKSVVTIPNADFTLLRRSKTGSVLRVPIELDFIYWIDYQSLRLNALPEPAYPNRY